MLVGTLPAGGARLRCDRLLVDASPAAHMIGLVALAGVPVFVMLALREARRGNL
jgi:hypothetical protein